MHEISGLLRRVWVEKPVNNYSTVFVIVSAITTLAQHWVHKPVNITRPLEECSAVKRLVNHWMHKPFNIRRRLNSCAICMPKMPIAFSALKPTISFSFCFSASLCSLHNHSSVFWRSSTTFRLVNTTEPVKNARNRHENDVYCGPSLCFVRNICTESSKCHFCHSHRYT